jgi:hypothetical protein
MANILAEPTYHKDVTLYDPYTRPDVLDPQNLPQALYFVACKHAEFSSYRMPPGSYIIDPHRYMPDQEGVTVLRIGEA